MSLGIRVSVVSTEKADEIVIETHPAPLRARKAALSQRTIQNF